MKKSIFLFIFTAIAVGISQQSHAQSLKDLFNKENIGKVVEAVTNTANVEMTGTWNYNGAAIELESDDILGKVGGTALTSVAEQKLDEQIEKIGLKKDEISFTFNADSTFTTNIGKKTVKGSYSYEKESKEITLTILKKLNVNGKLKYQKDQIELLFKADKLLDLLTLLSGKINNSALNAISQLSETYDGMMLGLKLTK